MDLRTHPPLPLERAMATAALAVDRYAVELPADYDGPNGTNGGFQAALLLHAARAAVPDAAQEPVSAVTHYLRPGRAGGADVALTVVHAGRRVTVVDATLRQEGRAVSRSTLTFATAGLGTSFSDLPPPAAPAPDHLERFHPPFEVVQRWFETVDARFVAGYPLSGAPQATHTAWLRLPAEGPLGPPALVLATDALPPVIFTRLTAPLPAATLVLDVRLTGARPDGSGWLLVSCTSRHAGGGLVEEDAVIWSTSGDLLVQSRQLRQATPGAFGGSG